MGTELIELHYSKMKREWKIAFLSTIIIGLLIHIYKFTNTLPNHDTLYNYYSNQNMIGSGRWFLSITCGISSYFDLPWVNGIISLFFIAVTTVIVIDILEIKNPFLVCLTGGLLVSFPGITETFFFEFTADGYMVAMFLSALAVWYTKANILSYKNTILASLCICFSCAIYQAYVSFALVLALCYFILKLLEDSFCFNQIKRWIITQLFVYTSGLAIYYVLWKALMHIGGFVANDYQGIDSLSLNLITILRGIPNSLKTVTLLFFEWNPFEHNWTLYARLNLIFLVCTVLAVVYAIKKTNTYMKKLNLILILISSMMIPFASCIWCFTSQDVSYRPMMLQSICLLYIFTAVLYEKYFSKIIKNLFALIILIIIFNNSIIANISYSFMNRSYFATFAMASEIVSDIHNLNTKSKEIIVVGNNISEVCLNQNYNSDKIPMLGQLLETSFIYDDIHLVNFLNETFYENYVINNFDWQNDDKMNTAISQMDCWPERNSIQVMDDIIIIKMQEEQDNGEK